MEELLQSFVLYNTYSRSFCGYRQTLHSPADALIVCALQESRHDSVLTAQVSVKMQPQCSAVQHLPNYPDRYCTCTRACPARLGEVHKTLCSPPPPPLSLKPYPLAKVGVEWDCPSFFLGVQPGEPKRTGLGLQIPSVIT